MSSLAVSIQHCSRGYSQFIQERKRNKWHSDWKGRNKTFFIHRQHDPVYLCVENPKESSELLDLIRVQQGYRILDKYIHTTDKSQLYLYVLAMNSLKKKR